MSFSTSPNPEQLAALRAFADRYGRCWKSVLRKCWLDGKYPVTANSALLQQVRNEFGPAWLVSFRVK